MGAEGPRGSNGGDDRTIVMTRHRAFIARCTDMRLHMGLRPTHIPVVEGLRPSHLARP